MTRPPTPIRPRNLPIRKPESGTPRLRPGQVRNPAAGFTLVECLAALIILAIGLFGVFTIFVAGVATHKKGMDQTTAGSLGQKVLAELEANLDDNYLKQLSGLAAKRNPRAPRSFRRQLELKDMTDPRFPSLYKYDLVLRPLDPRTRESYAVTLRIKWTEGGEARAAVFETVVLRKLKRD